MREKLFFAIISQYSKNIISLLGTYFLFLFLDVSLMGDWAFLNSMVSLGFLVGDLGLESIHYQYSQKEDFDDYFSSFFCLKSILLIINVNISLFLLTIFDIWNSKYIYIVLIIFFTGIIRSILVIFSINLRAKIKIFKVEIPTFLGTIGLNLFKIYFSFNISDISRPLILLSLVIIFFVIFEMSLTLIFSKRYIKIIKPKKSIMKSYLKDAEPLMINSILMIITSNIINIILKYSFDSETLAYYSLVNTYILPIIGIIGMTIVTICTPLFSQYFGRGDTDLIRKSIYLIEKYIAILIISVIIIIFLNGKLIFRTILPNYLYSLSILNILVFGTLFRNINRPYSTVLVSGKKQKLVAISATIYLIVNIILIFIFIPLYGILGYAAVAITLPIVWFFVFRYFAYKIFKIEPQFNIFLYLALGILTILFINYLKISVFNELIQEILIFEFILGFIGVIIFLIELFILKLLNREDIRFLRELLKFKRYKESFQDEFSKTHI